MKLTKRQMTRWERQQTLTLARVCRRANQSVAPPSRWAVAWEVLNTPVTTLIRQLAEGGVK